MLEIFTMITFGLSVLKYTQSYMVPWRSYITVSVEEHSIGRPLQMGRCMVYVYTGPKIGERYGDACQIWKWYDHYKIQSRGFETSRFVNRELVIVFTVVIIEIKPPHDRLILVIHTLGKTVFISQQALIANGLWHVACIGSTLIVVMPFNTWYPSLSINMWPMFMDHFTQRD